MAGSITVSRTRVGFLDKYTIAWVSDASGNVSGNSFNVEQPGELLQVQFTPDGGGTQPTNAYDLTMTDPAGFDVLGATGANLSNAASAQAVPVIGTYFRRALDAVAHTPVVANAGNAKGGTFTLLVRPL